MNDILLAIDMGYTYNPMTGIINGPKSEVKTTKNGYICIRFMVNRKRYCIYGHRFAYYYYHKKLPGCIDHKDRDRQNNKIDNLRESTQMENVWNTKHKGYHLNKRTNKWRSSIMYNGINKHLGYFNTEEEAKSEYLKAKDKYHSIKNNQ